MPTNTEIQAQARRQDLIIQRAAIIMRGHLAAEKNFFIRQSAEVYRRNSHFSPELLLGHEHRIKNILIKYFLLVGHRMNEEIFNSIKSQSPKLEKKAESRFDYRLRRWASEEAGRKAKPIAGTTQADINRAVQKAYKDEEPETGVISNILSVRGYSNFRADAIARTETHNAAMYASRTTASEFAEEEGVVMLKKWAATLDDRTRSVEKGQSGHLEMEDHPAIPMDALFEVPNKDGGIDRMDRPGDHSAPADQVINCVLPETKISATSFRAATRRKYEGIIYRIKLANGEQISVTPNHPILTPSGWVPANRIQNGDNLIGGAFTKRSGFCDVNIDNIHPSAKDIFDSLSKLGIIMRKDARGVNFHGDIPYHDVDVILTDSNLRDRINPPLNEESNHFFFTCPDFGKANLRFLGPLFCKAKEVFWRLCPYRIVRGSDLLFSLFLIHMRPFNALGFALSTMDDSVIEKATINNAAISIQSLGNRVDGFSLGKKINSLLRKTISGFFVALAHGFGKGFSFESILGKESVNAAYRESAFLADFRNRFPGKIGLVKVEDVHGEFYSGDVYNFETDIGYYIGDSIIKKNCRCVLTYKVQ